MYQNKLQEQGVWTIWWSSWSGFFQFNEILINNQDLHSQIENNVTPVLEYPTYSDDIEVNKTSAIPNFMPQILPDDEIVEETNSLNLKQRDLIKAKQSLWSDSYIG